jgi:hypothetical protein
MKPYVALLFLLAFAGVSQAANHNVRPGAGGTGSGADWTNAYTSLPGTLVRGDTYFLADGTYGSYAFDDAIVGTNLITIKKAVPTGTVTPEGVTLAMAEAHGTDTGWSDTFGDGEAVFTSSSNPWTIATGYYYIDGQKGSGKNPGTFGIRLTSTASRSSVRR